MSGFNGSGQFFFTYNWVNDANNGVAITASRMDTQFGDAAGGFDNCVTRDGQSPATADIPLGGFKLTGVATGTVATDAVVVGQLRTNANVFAVGAGTAQAITAAFSPAITALVDGMELCVRALLANTAAAPTFKPDAQTAHPITKLGGIALLANDIFGPLHEMRLRYNLANTRWELINPSGLGWNAYTSFTRSQPTVTASATSVQMGLGGTWALTPRFTGRVRITISGWLSNSGAGNTLFDATYGTGAAPANGDAATGTFFNSHDIIGNGTSSVGAIPATLVSVAAGLTVNTAYWFDATLATSSGTSGITINSVIIEEF